MPIGNQEETHSTPSDAVNAVNNNDVKVDTDTTMSDVQNQKHKILTSLASSYSGPVLKNAFNNNNNNIDDDDDDDDENDLLTKSCFASISLEKFGLEDAEEDEELTSLAWLHNTDVLKSLNTGDRSLCTSPIDEDFKENGGLYNPYSTQHPHNVPYNPLKHIGSKPPYSFSCLIFMSIEDSPHKKLPVKEIYNWILRHFPYFQNAPTGWKNSVRHNLSLNKCFKKVDKERGQSVGKGSLWCIDPAFRPNLLQALRKTPYHPYQQLQMLSTASPATAATNTSASNNPHLANILPKISNSIPGIKTELPEHVNAPPPDLFPFLSRRMALSKPDSDVTDIDVANTLVSLKEMSKLHQGYTGRSAARGVMRSSRSPSPPEFGSVRDRLQKHLYSQFLPIPSDVTPHPYADHSYSLVDLPTPDSTPPRSPSPSATHDATTSKRSATITDGSGTSPEPTPRKLTATPSTTQGKRRAMLQKLTASTPAVKGKRGRKKCKTDEMEETEKNRAESKTKQSKQALAQHKQKTSSQEDDGDDKQSLHAEDTLQVTDQPQRRMSSRVRRRKRRWSSSESPEPAPRQKEKQKKLRKKREKQPEKLQRGSATSSSSAPKRGRSTTRRSSTTGGSSSGGGGSRRGADSAESSIDGEYEFEEREVLGSPVKQEVMDPDLAELTQSLNLNAVKAEAPDGDNNAGSRARAASNESESDSGSELSDMEEELELQEQHRLAREQYRMELRAQALKARLRGDALMTMPPPPPTALMSTRSSRAEKDSNREQRKQEGTRGRKTLDSNSAASTSHNDKKSSSGGLGTGAGTSTDEEERRIVEGAGALLNFAGISTSNFSGMMTRRRTATQRQADAINNNDKSSKRRRLSKTKPSSTAQSLPSSSRMMTTRSVQPSTAAVLHSVDQGLPVVQVKEEKDDDAEYQKASSNVPADDSDSDLDGNVGHDLDAEVMFEVKQEPPAVVEPNDSSEPLALDNDDN